jgi:hypothetical protein
MPSERLLDWDAILSLLLGAAAVYALFILAWVGYKLYKDQRWARTFNVILGAEAIGPEQLARSESARTAFLARLASGDLLDENDRSLYRELIRSLNRLEALSIGIISGFYEEEVLYDYMGGIFVRNYRIFQPFIENRRSDTNSPRLYINLEAVARRWEDRRSSGETS